MVGPASGQRENESCVLIGCRPKQARHASLACSRIPTLVPLEKTVLLAINPLHTKHDYWILCLVFFFFCFFIDLVLSWSIKTLQASSPGRSGDGGGGGGGGEEGTRACNYISGISIPPLIPLSLPVDWAVRFPPFSAKQKQVRILVR